MCLYRCLRAQLHYIASLTPPFPNLTQLRRVCVQDDIAKAVKEQLSVQMEEYGYEIVSTLVIDIDPNAFVKAAMNDINGS